MSTNKARRTRGLLGLLIRSPPDVLKKFRVAVKRGNIPTQGPSGPIERSIDDPELIRLSVNYRKGLLMKSYLWSIVSKLRKNIPAIYNDSNHGLLEPFDVTSRKNPSRTTASDKDKPYIKMEKKQASLFHRSFSGRRQWCQLMVIKCNIWVASWTWIPVPAVTTATMKDGEQRRRSIFDRTDIVINQDEPDVAVSRISRSLSRSKSPASYRRKSNSPRRRSNSQRRRSNSPRRRSNSPRRKSNSPRRRSNSPRRRSNSPRRRSISPRRRSISPRRRSNSPKGRCPEKRSPRRGKSPDRRSSDRTGWRKSIDKVRDRRSSGREIIHRSEDRNRTKDRDGSGYKAKSISPLRPGEYIPFHPDLRKKYKVKEDDDKTRYSRRSTSSSRDRYKASTSTRRTISPRHHESSFTRSSRSKTPRKPSLSPSRKYRKSRSPATYSGYKRRDRSVEKRRSPSSLKEGDKKRSSSPRTRSPEKYARRSSRSPQSRYEKYRTLADTRRRRSRSPHPPVISFSPPRSRDRRPRSRSLDERDRRYREARRGQRRSRSRSSRRRSRSRSPRHTDHYKGPPPDFGYYEGIHGAEFWYPGPMRPGFSGMPRFYPPAYYPRGVPPGPIILPPRYPMIFPPVRPRIIYNNRKILKPVIQPIISEEVPKETVVSVGESEDVQQSLEDSKTKEESAEEEVEERNSSKD